LSAKDCPTAAPSFTITDMAAPASPCPGPAPRKFAPLPHAQF